MARRKVIITVAQTGAFHGKEANPNIPLTPEEIAASAYDCYNAGAAIIHIHARDQEGLSTNDPKVYSAIGSGIRARCNAILQYSTAPANREGTCAEDGMRLLYDPDLVKPEMCSLDCSLIGTSWGDRTFVYEWYRPFLLKYARKMRDMGIKLVSKSPWIFTISLGVLGMLLGCFMDQVPATAFMLAFVSRIYKELGYTSRDAYPHVANILTVFGVNIGGAMTPISHSLAILGIGIYEGATGESLSLFSYLAFGVPTGLILFVLLCVAVRLLTRPDMSKFKDFKIENVVKKQGPMTLREGTTAVVFFVTVIMWILPGVLKMFSDTAWVNAFNSFGITFWAILSVVVMAVIHIDGRPLLDVRTVVNQSINWGILIFISIGVYLGSAMSADSTGIVAAIQQNITPLTQSVAPVVVVFVIATVSVLMTNFASNVSTITVMTAVGVALAASSGGAISAVGIALVTTMCGSCAYLLPSSFATIAMLHGHEYSSRNQIYLFGIIMIVITSLIIGFVGYPIGCALTGS